MALTRMACVTGRQPVECSKQEIQDVAGAAVEFT
jgi:hypothetical protein